MVGLRFGGCERTKDVGARIDSEAQVVLDDLLVLVVGLLPAFVFGKPASGDPRLPPGFEQFPVANGLTRPTAMEFAPDGRLFVAKKGEAARHRRER